MKQGKSYFTVILWILLAAIAAYFGYHVISSLYAPLMTATVTPYEAGAGYYASGFVVREEELLYSQYGTTVLSCAEGAHVAANDTVATGYRSEDARLRQTRMDELSGQIRAASVRVERRLQRLRSGCARRGHRGCACAAEPVPGAARHEFRLRSFAGAPRASSCGAREAAPTAARCNRASAPCRRSWIRLRRSPRAIPAPFPRAGPEHFPPPSTAMRPC